MTDHLTEREIAEFAAIEKIDGTKKTLIDRVNTHIISCNDCAESVRCALDVYSLAEMFNSDGFEYGDMCTEISADAVEAEAYRMQVNGIDETSDEATGNAIEDRSTELRRNY